MNRKESLVEKNETVQIAYCKIFPPIGIARVGDSVQSDINHGWFVDPAFDNVRPDDFKYKDIEGMILPGFHGHSTKRLF